MRSLPYEGSEVEYTSARQTTEARLYGQLFMHFFKSQLFLAGAGVLQSAENQIKRNSDGQWRAGDS